MELKQQKGVCPNCGSEELSYGHSEPCGEEYYYEFCCEKCGECGREWYEMNYIETTINNF